MGSAKVTEKVSTPIDVLTNIGTPRLLQPCSSCNALAASLGTERRRPPPGGHPAIHRAGTPWARSAMIRGWATDAGAGCSEPADKESRERCGDCGSCKDVIPVGLQRCGRLQPTHAPHKATRTNAAALVPHSHGAAEHATGSFITIHRSGIRASIFSRGTIWCSARLDLSGASCL